MEEVFYKVTGFDDTINVNKVIGIKVIAANGHVIGRVAQARINLNTKSFEGIVVRKGLFRKIYIGRTYFQTLSKQGIILLIDPSVLLIGAKVVAYHGEVVGRVKEVNRIEKTNTIKSILAHSFLRGDFAVPVNQIKSIAKSIILKASYDAPKKSFWRRAK